MYSRQSVKSFESLINKYKSSVNFRHMSNRSSSIGKLHTNPTINQTKRNFTIFSTNFKSGKLQKSIKESNKMQESKKPPTLSLTYIPKSNQLALKVKNKKSGTATPNAITIKVDRNEFCANICNKEGSSDRNELCGSISNKESSSDNKGSKYCPICDAPVCKFEVDSSENPKAITDGVTNVDKGGEGCFWCQAPKCNYEADKSEGIDAIKSDLPDKQTAKNNSNSTTITIDRNELCQAFCNTSGDSKQRSDDIVTSSYKGSEYCPTCNAEVCKLRDDYSKMDDAGVKEGSEYCPLCKAAKCKLRDDYSTESNQPIAEGKKEAKDNATSSDSKEYCFWCDTPICKLEANSSANPNKVDGEIRSEKNLTSVEEGVSRNAKKQRQGNELSNKERKRFGSEPIGPATIASSNVILIEVDNSICQFCDQESSPSSTVARLSGSKLERKNDVDAKESSEYCPTCKLAKCKYGTKSSSRKNLSSKRTKLSSSYGQRQLTMDRD